MSLNKVFCAAIIGVGLTSALVVYCNFAPEPAGRSPEVDSNLIAPCADQDGKSPLACLGCAALPASMGSDPLPAGALARLGTVRLRPGSNITSMAFIADGKEVATSGHDGTVRFWDVATGNQVREWIGGGDLALLRDGKTLVIRGQDTLRFRDVATGKVIQQFGHRSNSVACITPDGKTLARADCVEKLPCVILQDVATGQTRHCLKGHSAEITNLAFSVEGRLLLSTAGLDQTVCLCNVATGQLQHKWTGPRASWTCVAFSSDSQTLAMSFVPYNEVRSGDDDMLGTGSEEVGPLDKEWEDLHKDFPDLDKDFSDFSGLAISFTESSKPLTGDEYYSIRVCAATTGKEIRRLRLDKNDGLTVSLAFSPNGKILVSQTPVGPPRLWDVATGKVVRELPGRQVAFSPDGKTLATSDGWSVRLWDIATGNEIMAPVGHQRPIHGLVYSPDGKTLLSKDHGVTRCWDLATGREIRQFPGAGTLSPDGRSLAAPQQDNSIGVFEVATGEELLHLKGRPGDYLGAPIFSNDARYVAVARSGPAEAGIRWETTIWEVATGKHLLGEAGIRGAAFSPGGKTVALARDKAIHLIDLATRKELCRFEGQPAGLRPKDAAFDGPQEAKEAEYDAESPEGWLLLNFSGDGLVLVSEWRVSVRSGRRDDLNKYRPIYEFWEVSTGRKLRQVRGPVLRDSPYVRSPDGKTLAYLAASGNSCSVYFWELATGTERGLLSLPRYCYFFAYSPDGRILATVGEDHTISLWEVPTGRQLRHFKGHHGSVTTLAFSPDGKTLASGSEDTTILVWELADQSAEPARRPLLSTSELEALWTDLATDAPRAFRASGALCSVPRQVVPYLQERLQPVPDGSAKRIAGLIADLDSDRFAVRQQATGELVKFAELSVPALRQALATKPSLELRMRVERLLEVLLAGPTPEQLRQLRAIESLEYIGSSEAKAALKMLARGEPRAWVTREAQAALERLGKK